MGRAQNVALGWFGVVALGACDRYVEIGKKPDLSGAGGAVIVPTPDASSAADAPAVNGVADASASDVNASDAPPSTILWSTSVETGDFSDWGRDGPAVDGMDQGQVQVSVTKEQAHSGSYAMKLAFDTADNQEHWADFYHSMAAGPAYYGAWFLIDATHVPQTYWSLFYFFFETEAGNSATRQGRWDINLNKLTLYFYDESTSHFVDAVPQKPFPIGTWTHVEAYFAYDTPGNGHIRVWLDGTLILDVKNLTPPPSNNLYWGIGSDTNGFTPSACTMYIDDATISTERLGP